MSEKSDNLPGPLYGFFHQTLHETLRYRLGVPDCEDVEVYLAALLAEFSRREALYGVKDAAGQPVESLVEMLAQADVRLAADSFDREREVHRRIGDHLLFWSGFFPEALVHSGGKGKLAAAIRQGSVSYRIVSTFEHDPYGAEAPVFGKLSDGFEVWREGLEMVRWTMPGLPRG